MGSILVVVGKLLTDKVVQSVIFGLLEILVKRSSNKFDDQALQVTKGLVERKMKGE